MTELKGDELVVNMFYEQYANAGFKHMVKVKSPRAEQFKQKMSKLILNADTKEKAALLSEHFFEMIMKNIEFEKAESMLDGISNSGINGD